MPHFTKQQLRRYPKREGTAKFVHYTSAENAIKIIESRRIWMRNTQCMSDYREMSHSFDLLVGARDKLNELMGSTLRWIGGSIDPVAFNISTLNERLSSIKV